MDRRKIYLKTERWRRVAERGATRIMARAMSKAVQPFKDALGTYSHASDAAELAPSKISRDEIEKGYLELYGSVMPRFADDAYNSVQSGRKSETLRQQWMDRIRLYVTSDLAYRITNVTQTTENRVRRIVLRAIDQGLGIDEIAAQIDTLGLEEIINNRSRVIARTETINASNKGALMGAEATGLQLRKEWITSIDGREREEHADADGETVPLGGTFIRTGEELEHPGDPIGSPGNVINCRCAIAFVTD